MSQTAAPAEEPPVVPIEVHEAVDAFMTSLVQVGALKFNAVSRTYVLACEMSETFFHGLVRQAKMGQSYHGA